MKQSVFSFIRDLTGEISIDRAKIVFLLFSVLGFILICFFKSFSGTAGILAMTAASVAAIISYGVYIKNACREFPDDQIGDNCYYLGFIYTVSSLTAALISLGSVNDDFDIQNLVFDFGIGLSSTVCGIACRVWFFHNSLKVAGEDEQKELMRFIDTARMLRLKFEQIASDFSDLQQTVGKAKKTFGDFSEKYAAELENMNASTKDLKSTLMDNSEHSAALINEMYASCLENLKTFNDRLDRFSTALNDTDKFKENMNNFIELSPSLYKEMETLQNSYAELNRHQSQMLDEIKEYNAEFSEDLQATKDNFNDVAETTTMLLKTAIKVIDK